MFTKEEKIRRLKSLSRIEMEVLYYFGQGMTDDEICAKLDGMLPKTLITRRTGIYKTLGINSPPKEKQNDLAQEYSPLIPEVCPNEDALKRWRPTKLEKNRKIPEETTKKPEERQRNPLLIPFLVILLALGYFAYRQFIIPASAPTPAPTEGGIPIAAQTVVAVSSPVFPNSPQPSASPLPPPTDTAIPPSATIPAPTASLAPANPILFLDDFNSGINSAWKLISGQPSIVNGALTASEDTWLQVGDPSWKNFKITMEMTGNDCWFSSSFNAIGVRGDSPDNMIAFKWANCENEWDIVSSGDWKQVANSRYQGNIWGPSTYIVEVKDSQFRASVSGQFNTSIILLNEDLQPGTIFLKLAPKTQLDSFKIEANP